MLSFKIPLVVKLAVSALLLAIVLMRVDAGSIFRTVSEGNLPLLFLATVLSFGAWFINTSKWQILLAGLGARVAYSDLLRLNFVGIFYNLVLPGQVGGEVVKGLELARKGVGAGISAMSVVADRVTGLFAVFLLGLGGAAISPSVINGSQELLPWLLGFTFALGLAVVLVVTGRGPSAVLAVGEMLRLPTRRIPSRLSRLWEAFPVRSFSLVWVTLILSIAFQLLVVTITLIICMALGISMVFSQLLWVVAVVTIMQSLPISIAGVGVREGTYVYLLQLYGVGGSSALALSLSTFAIQVLMASAGGLLQLYGHLEEKRIGT